MPFKTYNYDIKTQRLSWEKYALELAKTASLRSEDPYVQVGACALDSQHKVLGLGYNGLAPGKEVEKEFWYDRDKRRPFMIHAEANCLSLFTSGECEILAVTLMPCPSCATLIASYQIKKIVYQDINRQTDESIEILDFYDIKLQQLELEMV